MTLAGDDLESDMEEEERTILNAGTGGCDDVVSELSGKKLVEMSEVTILSSWS